MTTDLHHTLRYFSKINNNFIDNFIFILLIILLFSESSICLGFKKFQKAIDKS